MMGRGGAFGVPRSARYLVPEASKRMAALARTQDKHPACQGERSVPRRSVLGRKRGEARLSWRADPFSWKLKPRFHPSLKRFGGQESLEAF
jgi:hypothetical protein